MTPRIVLRILRFQKKSVYAAGLGSPRFGTRNMEDREMIPQVKKILYTTDLSKNSVYAFYHAVDLAKKYDAKICMLHVIETIPASAYGTRTDKLYQDQREAAETVIRNRIRNFCDRVDQKKNLACMERIAKILVENGDPAQEIDRKSVV